jgi:hypothetical protein
VPGLSFAPPKLQPRMTSHNGRSPLTGTPREDGERVKDARIPHRFVVSITLSPA